MENRLGDYRFGGVVSLVLCSFFDDALERFVLRRFLVILKALNLARGACVELRPLAWVCHEQFIKVWLVITKLGVYFSIQSSAL